MTARKAEGESKPLDFERLNDLSMRLHPDVSVVNPEPVTAAERTEYHDLLVAAARVPADDYVFNRSVVELGSDALRMDLAVERQVRKFAEAERRDEARLLRKFGRQPTMDERSLDFAIELATPIEMMEDGKWVIAYEYVHPKTNQRVQMTQKAWLAATRDTIAF